MCIEVGSERRLGRFVSIPAAARAARDLLKDKMMKIRNIENRLALVGALVVLIGVTAAAGMAFANDSVDAISATEAGKNTTNSTLLIARQAMLEAAQEAAAALKAETAFDLDNQLADITSTLVAARK